VLVFRDITERKRMEEEQARLASFPKLNPNPIVEIDKEGQVLFLNPAAQQLFPNLQESGCSHPWLADWETVAQTIFENESRMYTRDISVGGRWYQQAMYSVPGTRRIRTYGLDITERKLMEDSLRESEENYRTIVETSNEGIWVVDSETRTTYVNRRMAEMLGYAPEEMIGKKSSEFMDEEGKASLDLLLERRRQGVNESFEIKFLRKDGSSLWAISSAAPLRDKDGKFIGSLGMLTDITERKRAENALQESEHRYATTLASIGDAVIATDVAGNITFMNAVAEELTRWPLHDAMMKPARDVFNIINEHTRLKVEDPVTKVLDKGVIVGLANHTILIRRDGTEVAIDDSGAPIKDRYGITSGVVLVFRDITERKRAEEAIQESQRQNEFLASVIELSAQPFGVGYPDGRLGPVNKAFEQLTGYSREELQSIDWPKILTPPEWQDIEQKKLEELHRTRQPVRYEKEYVRKDGTKVPIELLVHLVANADGEPMYYYSFITDITERKQAEEALRESEERYRSRFNALIEGFCVIEMIFDEANRPVDYRFLEVNPAFEGQTGLHEAQGKLMRDLAPEHEEHWFEIYGKIALTGEPAHFENEARALNRWYEVRAFRVGGQESRKVAICFNDITERKLDEEEKERLLLDLAAEKARWQATVENMLDLVTVCDAEGSVTYINPAYLRLIGRPVAEGLPVQEHPDYYQIYRADGTLFKPEDLPLQKAAITEEEVHNVEIIHRSATGREFTAIFSAAPLRNAAGIITGAVAIGHDITESKQMELELLKARDELELKVQERTAELQNALGAAEESVKAKAAFLANMSHELRTPMNAVIGFSSLLLDDNLTHEQKEYIEGIRKGGEALLALINDILEFSRAEKDKIELEYQPFSLKHLIDESLDLVANQASKKGLNLSETVNYGTPDTIIGDHGRLRQILVNLLTNSVKFTDKGDVSVSVSSKAVEGDRHQIFFKVKDTGIGIPQDKMNEIFKPFVQVERTLSRKRDGVGLGLAITKNLVELMGGTIRAESIPGQGATFHFTIQAETIPGKQLDFGRMDSGIASESFQGLKPMRILVAEDNPSNQRVLVEMLKRLGYRADAVADGREVVQALERQDYDLVLMDIKMPEMDGITATQVIRKLRPENGPKIIAITAFALEGDREKCIEAGMDDYIAKPVQMRELAEVLKRCAVEIQ
jgi:PAS domain S-box-containing protein